MNSGMNSGTNSGMNHDFPDDPGPSSHDSGRFPDEFERAGSVGRAAFDEQALRRLMHGAVGELQPSDGVLDHLRRAVPARRTRRRRALGGAAAAVVLLGVALPAMLHVADEMGSTGPGDRPANAASSRHRSGDTVEDRQPGGDDDRPGDHARSGSAARGDHRDEPSGDGSRARESGAPEARESAGTTARPEPGATLSAAAPVCSRTQLGGGSGVVGAADAAGRVYGAFRIVNVSRAACAVTGPGSLVAQPRGDAAGRARIAVVDHTSGDPAAGLPDPRRAPEEVVLRPGQAYEVKFAWVPAADGSGACTKSSGGSPAPGASSSPSAPATTTSEAPAAPTARIPETPAADGSGGSGGSGGSDGSGGAGGSGGSGGSGGAAGAGITLTNTPVAGEPTAAEARIPDACAGTVYHTGALPAATPAA
ncbi:hypothetical protein I5Q34_11215 [Streptomyces sp. AV19]|uniref:hypothetical protein n=1 Tax=Streptomyces sp. AV19 TaxID=2793068 RepID=UPI0018FE7AB3|nr:hypothetical protein [Streptomyces sp. AV19]MBH1934838.1 hypothetical protein [Streptomyces sp. AV19]MDG4536969.1 hypothetical protein [Streptomyces sp. AV19]